MRGEGTRQGWRSRWVAWKVHKESEKVSPTTEAITFHRHWLLENFKGFSDRSTSSSSLEASWHERYCWCYYYYVLAWAAWFRWTLVGRMGSVRWDRPKLCTIWHRKVPSCCGMPFGEPFSENYCFASQFSIFSYFVVRFAGKDFICFFFCSQCM